MIYFIRIKEKTKIEQLVLKIYFSIGKAFIFMKDGLIYGFFMLLSILIMLWKVSTEASLKARPTTKLILMVFLTIMIFIAVFSTLMLVI